MVVWISILVFLLVVVAGFAVAQLARRRGATTVDVARPEPKAPERPAPRGEGLGARIRSVFGGGAEDP